MKCVHFVIHNQLWVEHFVWVIQLTMICMNSCICAENHMVHITETFVDLSLKQVCVWEWDGWFSMHNCENKYFIYSAFFGEWHLQCVTFYTAFFLQTTSSSSVYIISQL